MTQPTTRIPLDPAWERNQRRKQFLNAAVAEFDLDVRTVNGLESVSVLYIHELVKLTRSDLMKIPNFGLKSVDHIVHMLAELGLSIRDETG